VFLRARVLVPVVAAATLVAAMPTAGAQTDAGEERSQELREAVGEASVEETLLLHELAQGPRVRSAE